MQKSKILSMLGMAMKAGKLCSGEFMTENAIKSGEAKLVIVASDASENTKKKFRDKSAYRHVPFMVFSDRDNLGACIGKSFRSCLSVNDQGFADALKKTAVAEEIDVY